MESSLALFHNNIRSLNPNLEDLQTHYLQELSVHFNIIGSRKQKLQIQLSTLVFLAFQDMFLNMLRRLWLVEVRVFLLMKH